MKANIQSYGGRREEKMVNQEFEKAVTSLIGGDKGAAEKINKLIFTAPELLGQVLNWQQGKLRQYPGKKRALLKQMSRQINDQLLDKTSAGLMHKVILHEDGANLLNHYFELGAKDIANAVKLGNLIADSLYCLGLDNEYQALYTSLLVRAMLWQIDQQLVQLVDTRWKITEHWQQWLLNLFEGVGQKNKDAESLLAILFCHCISNSINPLPIDQTTFKREGMQFNLAVLTRQLQGETSVLDSFNTSPQDLVYPLPEKHFKAAKVVHEKVSVYFEGNNELLEFLQKVQKNAEKLRCQIQSLWQEIVSDPQCFIRSGGRDKINIRIPEIKHFGLTALIFICESTQFPEISFDFILNSFGRKYTIEMGLDNQGVLRGINPSWSQSLILLLNFITVDCYHQIICNKHEAVGSRMERRIRYSKSKGGQQVIEEVPVVRPHFMRLPEGRQASEQALERLREHRNDPNIALPEGKTFVKEFERKPIIKVLKGKNWRIYDDLPSLFSYTRERIEEIINKEENRNDCN